MPQYQSFPGAPGDSLTLDKLKKLRLPEMEGKSFLDVGCNEGFFCGFARFQGATRAVGQDRTPGFVERARARFPDCEFHVGDWEMLPQESFDVILLASALHYADDQQALVHRLVDMLSDDGVLILELGIVTSKKSEWVSVQRGSDMRDFPTMPLLREMLKPYAWKWMGPSVNQSGDPVSRHVLHISKRRRTAYLLMHPPAFGKSSIAHALFAARKDIPVVTGDQVIGKLAAGTVAGSERLLQVVRRDYSPFRIDQAIQRLFDEGCGEELADIWLAQVGARDFALDMYVPVGHQAAVKTALQAAGYLVVSLEWDRPGSLLIPEATLDARAEAFYLSMSELPPQQASSAMRGFVDEVDAVEDRLRFRGWAADEQGRAAGAIEVVIDGRTISPAHLQRQLRPDVQRHLDLPHALLGYVTSVALEASLAAQASKIRIRAIAADGTSIELNIAATARMQLQAILSGRAVTVVDGAAP